MMLVERVALRPLATEDIPVAIAIETSVYPQPWTEQIFADELAHLSRTYLGAWVEEALVGYGGVMLVSGEAHITTLVVAPGFQGHRVGTRLMLALTDRAVQAGAVSLTLEVRVSNEPAQALYRRFGLSPVGVRKNYYRTEDALIMWVHDVDGQDYSSRLDSIRQELV